MRFTVFILALLVRIAAIETTGGEQIAFGDGPDYVLVATSLCEQGVYPERGNLPFFRAPGLPFFIAAVTACEPSRTRWIKYGLAVCDAVTVLLLFLLALQVHGTRVHAAIAGVLAALHPFFIAGTTDVRSEPLFTVLLVGAMWFLRIGAPASSPADAQASRACAPSRGETPPDQPPRRRRSAASAGICIALAALTRPTGLLCIPLFALFLLTGRQDAGEPARWKPALRSALVFLFAAALTLAPWVIRNVIRFGEPIVVNDAAGFNLWRGTHPELMRVVETHDRESFARRSWAFETKTVSEAALRVDGKTPGARDRQWRAMALENVRRDPAFAFRSAVKKAAWYWRPWLHAAEHGRNAIALSIAVFAGLYLLGGLGLALHRDRRLVLAVLLFFAAMWLAHIPYFPSIRLRMPLTDPLLIVFAAAPVARAVRRVPRVPRSSSEFLR